MATHFDLFCTEHFLRWFHENKPDIEDETSFVEAWRSFLVFVKNTPGITCAVNPASLTKEDLERYSLLRYFFDLYMQSAGWIAKAEDFEKASSEKTGNPYKLCFNHEKEPTNEGRERQWGIPFIGEGRFWEKWGALSKSCSLKVPAKVKKEGLRNWADLAVYKQPVYSIIIVDNYVLSHYWSVENNLFQLLRYLLLDKNVEQEVEIVIITRQFYWKKGTRGRGAPEEDISVVYNRIKRFLSRYLNKDFQLTLLKKGHFDSDYKEEFHDRYIFTNTCVYRSGNTFNYFGRNGESITAGVTDFEIIPLTARNESAGRNPQYYLEHFQGHLRQIASILRDDKKQHLCVGPKRSRLLEWAERDTSVTQEDPEEARMKNES